MNLNFIYFLQMDAQEEALMEHTFKFSHMFKRQNRSRSQGSFNENQDDKEISKSLLDAFMNEEYEVKQVVTDNMKIKDFLFSLGCYPGEKITVVSRIANQYVIVIKDARYSIDRQLARCIIVA